MPRVGDHTLLSWREGPPYLTQYRAEDAAAARYSSARRFLRLHTGYFSAEFDTEKIAITGFMCPAVPQSEELATQSALTAGALPAAELQLVIRSADTDYVCTGRRATALNANGLPKPPLEFPVRIIESGRFFQKFTLHELEFRDSAGQLLPVSATLEISAWPDRLAFTLVTRPNDTLGDATIRMRLVTTVGTRERAEQPATAWATRVDHRLTLALPVGEPDSATSDSGALDLRVQAVDPAGRAVVRWNPEEAAFAVTLQAPPWEPPAEGNYPAARLDAWEDYAVTLENGSDLPRRIGLQFDYVPLKSIINYVPMLLDDQGRPTGIPVQISKNWHVAKPGVELPYAGQWMHGRTWLQLPANSRMTFHYGTTFARWGGVPTASGAQLSLVGWGDNGFWEQMALGGFGESFCFQPGRVMRRALLTDFRPLFQRGFAKDERWAWTSNLGGGDTMVRIGPDGRYVPFKRHVTRHVSPGPNLAHLVYEEVSADAAVRSRVEVLLPRTDDYVRVYLRVRYEVSRRVAFAHLALFQLGAEFYNETDSPLIAWGDAAGLVAESRLEAKPGVRLLPAYEARGEQPWISLHGQPRRDAERVGQGGRGLVVREWRAVLGGRPVVAPYFAAVGSRGAKPRLAAELVPPPDVTTLEAGDLVEMLLELVVLPLTAGRYYGPDESFRTALAAGANTWNLVQREAAANRPAIRLGNGTTVRDFPLNLPVETAGDLPFRLAGGLGWVPVRFSSLGGHDGLELFRLTGAGRERVIQGDPARAYWQTDYTASTAAWSVTYNLPVGADPADYVAVVRTRAGVAPRRRRKTRNRVGGAVGRRRARARNPGRWPRFRRDRRRLRRVREMAVRPRFSSRTPDPDYFLAFSACSTLAASSSVTNM